MSKEHTGDMRWGTVTRDISSQSFAVKQALILGEEMYQEMLELYQYTGGNAQGLADQLFKEVWEGRSDIQANGEEVAKATDAINAMTAIHELYEAATNVAVAQLDRMASLRRMS